jgi:hypothetical protein
LADSYEVSSCTCRSCGLLAAHGCVAQGWLQCQHPAPATIPTAPAPATTTRHHSRRLHTWHLPSPSCCRSCELSHRAAPAAAASWSLSRAPPAAAGKPTAASVRAWPPQLPTPHPQQQHLPSLPSLPGPPALQQQQLQVVPQGVVVVVVAWQQQARWCWWLPQQRVQEAAAAAAAARRWASVGCGQQNCPQQVPASHSRHLHFVVHGAIVCRCRHNQQLLQ